MIDAPTTLILLGTALQAAPPARTLVAKIRRRTSWREPQRYLAFTPLARRDRALEQLAMRAETAVFD